MGAISVPDFADLLSRRNVLPLIVMALLTDRSRAVAGNSSDFDSFRLSPRRGRLRRGPTGRPTPPRRPRLRARGIPDRGRRLARRHSAEEFSFACRPVVGPFDALPPVSGSCLRPRTLPAQCLNQAEPRSAVEFILKKNSAMLRSTSSGMHLNARRPTHTNPTGRASLVMTCARWNGCVGP